jgi:hypothetical protein
MIEQCTLVDAIKIVDRLRFAVHIEDGPDYRSPAYDTLVDAQEYLYDVAEDIGIDTLDEAVLEAIHH